MKKILSALLTLSLMVSFTACSDTDVSETDELYNEVQNVDITKVKRPKKEEAESESDSDS